MFHIPINEAESVLEPYYDGGDSYSDNEKYSRLCKYEISPRDAVVQNWCSFDVKIQGKNQVVLKRDCNVKMGEYDVIRVFLNASKSVKIRLFCDDNLIIDQYGKGEYAILCGDCPQGEIRHIKYEFVNDNSMSESVTLFYLGAGNKEKQANMCKQQGNFTDEWEGCFSENPTIKLFSQTVMSDEKVEKLKVKMEDRTFKIEYNKTKAFAESVLNSEPEALIKRHLCNGFRKPIPLVYEASALAYVGFVEKRDDMLHLACRYALSICCCDYWSSDNMETAPSVTWYHRSFNERTICMALAYVLDFAGDFLTWHGRNIIYNSLILKGLPRFEADFMTMEYIRFMNQGIAFEVGYIITLISLVKRFPRYEARIAEAEKDLRSMFTACISEDGGMHEGAEYWQYTMLGFLFSAYLLAQHKGLSLKNYIENMFEHNNIFIKTADFGLAMLDGKGNMRGVGDSSGTKSYLNLIPNVMAQLTGDEGWYNVIKNSVETASLSAQYNSEENAVLQFLMCEPVDNINFNHKKDENFKTFYNTGYTILLRNGIEFFGVSGASFSHCHGDKGSFTIDKNGEHLIVDRGICPYDKAGGLLMIESEMHNLTIPQFDDKSVVNQKKGEGFHAILTKSQYENGCFVWQSDNENVWDKNFVISNVRTIVSNFDNEFIIIDEFTFVEPMFASFRLNMYSDKQVKIQPQNWQPQQEEYMEYGVDGGGNKVYQLRLLAEKQRSMKLITKLIINE